MKRQPGFSLLELLIVVAIILIIAAIVIPNLLQARISANEASAQASVRTIASAEMSYITAYPDLGYTALPNLGGPTAPCTPSAATACIVDSTLATGNKSGYNFAAAGSAPINGANTEFLVTALPTTLHITGTKAFCAFEDSVIRFTSPAAGLPTRASCLSYSAIAQ